jgi:hypothetical protein
MRLEPLWEIRLRTPRLELRLPTDDKLLELYRVAEAGIHPSHKRRPRPREDWRCPVPVEIDGLEAALPLFGVTRSS